MKKPKSARGCGIASRAELPSKPIWCQLCALLLSLTFPLATVRAESQSWISGRVFWNDTSANWLSAEESRLRGEIEETFEKEILSRQKAEWPTKP